MTESIKDAFAEFKTDILLILRESGIFSVLGLVLFALIIVILALPFFLIGLPFYWLNEKSKSWGIKSFASEVSQDD